MAKSLCGADCSACPWNSGCAGCVETDGCPFGETCMVADCCKRGTLPEMKAKLIAAFRSLGMEGMEDLTDLFALRGAFINMEYELPCGQKTKFWNDNKIYLGNQLEQKGTDRCYGLAADENYLMVCEYGPNGTDQKLLVFKRWNNG